jgi:hypothetical protein
MLLSVVSKSTKVCRFSMVNDLSSLDSTSPDSCIQAAYTAAILSCFFFFLPVICIMGKLSVQLLFHGLLILQKKRSNNGLPDIM